jgi:hypothetical protein
MWRRSTIRWTSRGHHPPALPDKGFGLARDKGSRGPPPGAPGGGDAQRTVRGHSARGCRHTMPRSRATRCGDSPTARSRCSARGHLRCTCLANIGECRQNRCGIGHLIPSDTRRPREAAAGSCPRATSGGIAQLSPQHRHGATVMIRICARRSRQHDRRQPGCGTVWPCSDLWNLQAQRKLNERTTERDDRSRSV